MMLGAAAGFFQPPPGALTQLALSVLGGMPKPNGVGRRHVMFGMAALRLAMPPKVLAAFQHYVSRIGGRETARSV
jgi:hypothetical protein